MIGSQRYTITNITMNKFDLLYVQIIPFLLTFFF